MPRGRTARSPSRSRALTSRGSWRCRDGHEVGPEGCSAQRPLSAAPREADLERGVPGRSSCGVSASFQARKFESGRHDALSGFKRVYRNRAVRPCIANTFLKLVQFKADRAAELLFRTLGVLSRHANTGNFAELIDYETALARSAAGAGSYSWPATASSVRHLRDDPGTRHAATRKPWASDRCCRQRPAALLALKGNGSAGSSIRSVTVNRLGGEPGQGLARLD